MIEREFAQKQIDIHQELLDEVTGNIANRKGMTAETERELNWTRLDLALGIVALERIMEEEQLQQAA